MPDFCGGPPGAHASLARHLAEREILRKFLRLFQRFLLVLLLLLFSIFIIVNADHLAERAVVEAVVAVVLLLRNVETGDEGLLNKNQTSCGDLPVGHSVPSNSYSLVVHTGTFKSITIIIFHRQDNREI